MKPKRRRGACVLVGVCILVIVSCVSAGPLGTATESQANDAESTLYPTGYVWRDVDGAPLPVQDQATICEVLRTAPIIESELMDRGVAGNIKVLLDHEGTRIQAVIRVIDRKERVETGSARIDVKYRDSYIFEAAAYDLDRLLGIGRVPPTVLRPYQGLPGSIQIWMEGVAPEDIMLAEERLTPPDPAYWWHQKGVMWVFDALIANTDRNQGNLLIDDDWNLYFIDHTRAFRETSALMDVQELDTCERQLWRVLRDLDPAELRTAAEPYLSSKEISKLLLRHKKLIKHFEKKIKKKGEDEVLYDLKVNDEL